MRLPLCCGSSSCACTWLRATLLLPLAGWTQPNSVPSPSVALSALPLLWQLANHWVQEEPDTEGQILNSNIKIMFKKLDFCKESMRGVCSLGLDQNTPICYQFLIFFLVPFNSARKMLFLTHCPFLFTTPLFYCCVQMTVWL